jgi:uncharacterized membrane protein YdjX (TVP38/TMEM64 family)
MKSRRLWIFTSAVFFIFVFIYILFETFSIPLLADPAPIFQKGGWIGAIGGILLLILDVLLPIPSSIVMVAHGVLFGVIIGTFVSIAGRTGAFLFGYYLGSKALLFVERFIPQKEIVIAKSYLEKRGLVAIILSRPIPIISETMTVVAGAVKLPFWKSLGASTLGSLPEAFLYAIAGAFFSSLNYTALIFILIMFIAIAFHLSTRLKYKFN